jgi:pSer/pThr/pTyr-binding forkhead associated (FHA) protein
MPACNQCNNWIPDGHRFCGVCGAPAPSAAPPAPAATPAPAVSAPKPSIQARLILIKGEGFDGVSYQLNSQHHLIGRLEGTIIYPDDHYLSPLHADLYYENDKLLVSDRDSVNGVFIKLKEPVEIHDGSCFLAGEQLLRFEKVERYKSCEGINHKPGDDTKFYGCPPEETIHFRIVHLFRNDQEGTVFYAPTTSVSIGREQCDLSFPFDRHISGRHARVYEENGRYFLQDLGSKNGTFYRIRSPRALSHGDYFIVGQQLMRVEISA